MANFFRKKIKPKTVEVHGKYHMQTQPNRKELTDKWLKKSINNGTVKIVAVRRILKHKGVLKVNIGKKPAYNVTIQRTDTGRKYKLKLSEQEYHYVMESGGTQRCPRPGKPK